VRIFGAIVEVAPRFLASLVSYRLRCGPVGWAPAGPNDFRVSVAFRCFSEEFQCCILVALLGDISLQYFAFVINSAPQVMRLAPDLDEDLIKMPPSLRHLAHRFGSPFTDFTGKMTSEPIDPEADAFMADIDATLVE